MTECNYVWPSSTAEAWLTTHERLADEPPWSPMFCEHCGEVRRVAVDYIGDAHVSTVLIAARHRRVYREARSRRPTLYDAPYETLVRTGRGEWGMNWETRDEALRGHWAIADRLRQGKHPDADVLYSATEWDSE